MIFKIIFYQNRKYFFKKWHDSQLLMKTNNNKIKIPKNINLDINFLNIFLHKPRKMFFYYKIKNIIKKTNTFSYMQLKKSRIIKNIYNNWNGEKISDKYSFIINVNKKMYGTVKIPKNCYKFNCSNCKFVNKIIGDAYIIDISNTNISGSITIPKKCLKFICFNCRNITKIYGKAEILHISNTKIKSLSDIKFLSLK